MFGCKHKWSVLLETTTESKAEQISRIRGEGKTGAGAFEKKLIQIVTCDKCGAINRWVENIC